MTDTAGDKAFSKLLSKYSIMRLGSLRHVKVPSCRRRLLDIANEIHEYTLSFEI